MSDLAFDLGGDLGGETGATAITTLDHVALGLQRLPWQWRNKANMLAVFTVFLARYNALEAAFQDLLLLRSIDTANVSDPTGTVGDQLDQIGAKVGQARNGLNNTDYRRYIRAKIATNNSNGRIEDLISIASLILNDPNAIVQVTTEAVATAIVNIIGSTVDDNLASILIQFLRVAVVGGVRLQMITHPRTARKFRFSKAASPRSGLGTGFGSASDSGQPTLTPYASTSTVGGHLGNVRE